MARVELAAWCCVVLPACLLFALARLRCDARAEPRVRALLRWYPAPWRARHGDQLAALLRDAIDGGHDGLRLWLDVARAGVGERLRTRRASALLGMLAAGLGWTLIVPQGIVATLLGQIGGTAPAWLLPLHVAPPARWLVAAAMIACGTALVVTSFALFAQGCGPRRTAAR